jgi:hypothetical protein
MPLNNLPSKGAFDKQIHSDVKNNVILNAVKDLTVIKILRLTLRMTSVFIMHTVGANCVRPIYTDGQWPPLRITGRFVGADIIRPR